MDLDEVMERLGSEFQYIFENTKPILQYLALKNDAKILDVGTGQGRMAITLALNGYKVLTGELESDDSEYAKQNWLESAKKAEVDHLKKMCTWFNSEKPDLKSSYKLPHHKAEGHKAVWRGVAASMAALLGARGGVKIPEEDRKGVYNHLKKHYKQFDKKS